MDVPINAISETFNLAHRAPGDTTTAGRRPALLREWIGPGVSCIIVVPPVNEAEAPRYSPIKAARFFITNRD